MNLAAELAEGCAALQIGLAPEVQQKLLAYLALLQKWNGTYNLTAVRGIREMLTHHVLDSLAVAPHLRGRSWVDVGSGAGLPGIPLALAKREATFTLVESSHKKATFLRQAVIELDLANVSVACSRVETWQAAGHYDVVIARALADLAEFLGIAGRLCASDGVLAAMKGVYPHEELAQLPPSYRVDAVLPLSVPGLAANRHLVLMRPAQVTRG